MFLQLPGANQRTRKQLPFTCIPDTRCAINQPIFDKDTHFILARKAGYEQAAVKEPGAWWCVLDLFLFENQPGPQLPPHIRC